MSLDDSDAETLAWVSATVAWIAGDCQSATEMADRAVALDPNSFFAWSDRGWIYKVAGLPEEAVHNFERAIRMSPVAPRLHIASRDGDGVY
jgi:adenylate cyclase